jgi:hypothetical protein
MLATRARRRPTNAEPPAPTRGGPTGPGVDRLYAGYATAFLIITLLSGVWLRAAFLHPPVLGAFSFGHALHAHSHLAFFGWTTMALFALLIRRTALDGSAPWLRWHAHFTGAASAAAFVGFLLGGYNVWTISLSVVHVLIWLVFTSVAWTALHSVGERERIYFRGALSLLVIAGAGAMAPGFVMAKGIEDPWIGQIAIHSFLSPFMGGWLMLGAMGAAYGSLTGVRYDRAAFWFTMAGVLPAALLHPTAAPPASWILLVGRFGTGLIGVGALLFAIDLLRAKGIAPLLAVGGVAAALKGMAEVSVATGIGLHLIGMRSLSIAYLHLVLLGAVTAILMAAALRLRGAPVRTALYGSGLAVMVASLGLLGFPPAVAGLAAAGISPLWLLWSALTGGALCAAAVVLLLPEIRRSLHAA